MKQFRTVIPCNPCVYPSRAPVLSFARYFQAPATQAIFVVPHKIYFLAFGNSRGVCSLVFGYYIIACFCMLLFPLSYVRCTL